MKSKEALKFDFPTEPEPSRMNKTDFCLSIHAGVGSTEIVVESKTCVIKIAMSFIFEKETIMFELMSIQKFTS